ncbi:hypothetical protein BDM02DRAFT_3263997 [Thelephora ganbajun]|uniref:Uncharacterized protein n=1 Tax=Thelephora ganbajun TaxID=370292 RepID=A0ACB6Z1L2_THEGA|nr:hypothetical protein BDM02DRAFT_3263997 [Thelephora ganbajun]
MYTWMSGTSKPAFSFDPARLPMTKTGGKFRLHSLFSFGNEHSIEIGDQYHTPFDSYTFSAFVFAIERDTNKSIPITSFLVGDTGPADFTTTSSWVPSVNKFTNDTQAGSTIVEVESSTLFAEIRHSTRAQALTISMFAINWVLTLCSMVITSIVFNWWGEVRDGVALLPVTIILSIPAIRNLYVGSPPFGVFFDVVGFFPQMLIVVVCTMMILFVFTMRSIRNRDVAHEKGEFQIGASQLPLV